MKKKLTAEEEKQRNIRWIRALFLVYLLIVIKLIIFKYPMDQLRAIAATWRKDVILEGLDTANFTPFKTIRMYIDYAYMLNSFENLVGNILVFVPFGFLLPIWKKAGSFWVMLLNAVIFVLGIEVFQLFSAFGAFDVDDIILNCLGAVWGYLFYLIVEAIRRKRNRKQKQKDKQTGTGQRNKIL